MATKRVSTKAVVPPKLGLSPPPPVEEKTHWGKLMKNSADLASGCTMVYDPEASVTTDKTEVTCKKCREVVLADEAEARRELIRYR
jgi:hypothetical protein